MGFTVSSHCRPDLKLRNQDGRDGFFSSLLRLVWSGHKNYFILCIGTLYVHSLSC